MTSRIVLRIRKRTQPEWLIGYILAMPFLFYILFDLLPFPTFLKYSLDISWICLVLFLGKSGIHGPMKTSRAIFLWIVGFLCITFFVYLPQFQSVFYYLWGIRNNFRFYVLFFACAVFLQKRDVEGYFKLFDTLFWINAVVCLVQYILFGKYGDWLGGLFGTEKGCNGYLNLFFVIITANTIISYLLNFESISRCVVKIGTCVIIAAIAEIKFYYVEFLVILVSAMLITNFSWRKLLLIIFGTLGLFLGVGILGMIFPNSKNFLSLDTILQYAMSEKGYTSGGDINRLTAIPYISKRFLNAGAERIFGMGLGNCDTASFSFLITPFYQRFGSSHYLWFSFSMIFLEMGYVGLIFVIGFFVLVFLMGINTKGYSNEDKRYCYISAVVALCCILILLYNVSLRTEAGYMAYFVLSIPFIIRKNQSLV
jgi:hypothetical protein